MCREGEGEAQGQLHSKPSTLRGSVGSVGHDPTELNACPTRHPTMGLDNNMEKVAKGDEHTFDVNSALN